MTNIKPSNHILHSFCLSPDVKFDGQNPQEQVILVLRSHPITQLPWIINGTILLILLLIVNLIFPNFLDLNQIFFINFFGLVFIFSYFWFNFLSWFFNVGIITNERIIDVDFHAVIYKEITMAMLNKVEDITARTGGFFASFFDYGNIFIQTAGTEANIEFMNVPKPSEVTKIINSLLNK